MHQIRENYKKDGLNDIAYNFLVGGDGSVYVGRDWQFQDEHTTDFDDKSICIAFIGTFDNQSSSDQQLHSAHQMIDIDVEKKHIKSTYDLYGQSQLSTKVNSPGTILFEIIKTWKHWRQEYY